MSEHKPIERKRFGNWMPDRRGAVGGLTLPGWVVLLSGAVLAVLGFAMGQWGLALGALLVSAIVVVLFGLRFGDPAVGRSLAQIQVERWTGAARARRGEARYRTGLFSNLPADQLTALPGLLVDMIEIDGTDGLGTPYTLLHHRTAGTLVVVFACAPDGTHSQEQEKTDQDVAWYGAWLASLSQDPAIAGATVVGDSALRSSAPLVERIISEIDPDAPEIARAAATEGAYQLPPQDTEATSWACIAWDVDALASSLEDAHAEVAAKLPYHVDALRQAGGGAVVPATSGMLAAAVRIAYSPDLSTELATDALRGHRNPLRVTQAGPDYFDDDFERVVMHDGVASMTAFVLVPPRIEITESTLNALFGPADRFLRKRVCVMYRPVSQGKTMRLVEQLSKSSSMEASAKARVSAQDQRKVRQAAKLEDQVVEGAAMTRFSIAVTVTFNPDARSYREATTKLKTLLEQSSLTYRFCEWDAGPAFHSTLPLGILPWLHESVAEKAAGVLV